MFRRLRVLLLTLLSASFILTGCDDKNVEYQGDDENENGGSESPDPRTIAGQNEDGGLALFPSDLYSVEDASRFTGRTVTFTYDDVDVSPRWIPVIRSMADQIEGLDGFGTSAGAWINFSKRIDTDQALADENTYLGYFEGEDVEIVPSDVTADPQQITIRPLTPLPPNRKAFYFVTTDLKNTDGEAVTQDPVLTDILEEKADDTYSDALQTRIRNTAARMVDEGLVASVENIAALAVFTTQSIYETDLEVAAYIRNYNDQNSYDANPQSNNDCDDVVGQPYRLCTFTFEVPNFIEEDRTILDDAVDHVKPTYTMTGYAFLPPENPAEDFDIPWDEDSGYAVNIFGHGLGGNALGAGDIAKHTALEGLATVAIDAPIHGGHPLKPEGLDATAELEVIQALFGIDIDGSSASINTKLLRDGWRHSNYDKLALIEALKQGIDLNNDGSIDLSVDRLTYLGGSLGAIQGAQFSSLTDVPRAGLYAVAGGRLSDIVRYGTLFSLVNVLLFPNQKPSNILKALVMLQTSVEKGDGVNWAHHVLNDRLQSGDGYPNDNIPDVAVQISVPDEIVPEESGMALARALGVEGVGTAALEDPMVTFGNATLTGNHASGATAGILQTDCIRRAGTPISGPWQESGHAKSADSLEGIKYWTDALVSLFGEDAAVDASMELNDPYAELGIVRGATCEDTYIDSP